MIPHGISDEYFNDDDVDLPPDIAAIMVKKNPGTLSMLTGHAYAFAPSVGREVFRLLRNEPIQQTLDFLKPGIDAAKQAGLPFRLDEAGSAWGGADVPDMAPTLAELW